MGSEVLGLDFLEPSHVHQTAAPDVGLAGVDHLGEHHHLWLLVEEDGLGMNVTLLSTVQRSAESIDNVETFQRSG